VTVPFRGEVFAGGPIGTRRVTAGASSASPAATVRIARTASSADADLSRNPLVTGKIALAVTGGTGAYAGARGEVIAREGSGTATDVFRLTR
jgi:hypothetical protein